jgi:amidophosphoribosyltransferase
MDTEIDGRNVHDERLEMGRILAREHPVDADVVIGVPDSGLLAAMGYAEESGIPYRLGFRKSPYVTRSFIQANQALRKAMIQQKLSVIRSVVEGKRVVVTDDSIMRGNSSQVFMRMLWAAGATEVHVRISSPPNRNGCRHGIDTGDHRQLLAYRMDSDIDRMTKHIEATSLGHISLDGLLTATNMHQRACTECMSGHDPLAATLPVFLGMPAVASLVK